MRGKHYTCTNRCVLRRGCSIDSDKVRRQRLIVLVSVIKRARCFQVGILEVGEVVEVAEWKLNECRTTRIRLVGPTPRWTNATMTDGTLTIEPLPEYKCRKRTQLRKGYEMDSEKCGVLEAGAVLALAWRKKNEADITRCKLVRPDGEICWCGALHSSPRPALRMLAERCAGCRANECSSRGEVVLAPM